VATVLKSKKLTEIYDYDKEIDRIYAQAKKELSSPNYQLFEKYDQNMVNNSIAKATRRKHLRTIVTESRIYQKEWQDIKRDDVDKLVFAIMKKYSTDKGQESHSSYDMKKILRIFVRWIKTGSREKSENGDPVEIRGIRVKTVKDTLARESLLTENDREKLLRACGNDVMMRAFIDVHLEAGTRPGEILNLQIKHVKFDNVGAVIAVDGKTYARPIRLIRSVPNLSQWLNCHPYKEDHDWPLWISVRADNHGESLNYMQARHRLLKVAEKAQLSKRIFLNLFRHTEATEMANHLTEAQLRKRQGWSATSRQPARYVHMVNADVEKAILKKYGLAENIPEEPKTVPKKCIICDTFNNHDSTSCTKCGKPLDLKTALQVDEQKDEMKKYIDQKFERLLQSQENEKKHLEVQLKNKIKELESKLCQK